MRLKAEFRRRLEKAFEAIEKELWMDEQNKAEYTASLIPIHYHLLSYLWMKSYKDLFKD